MNFFIKLFWSIVCEVYSAIVLTGYEFPPPDYLFNKPKNDVSVQFIEEIHADITFNSEERLQIIRAARDLERFTNNWFKFDITFDLHPRDIESIDEKSVIIRAGNNHPEVNKWDDYTGVRILGLCLYKKNLTTNLYIAADRITNNALFRTTMIHELGHSIGLNHTDRHSVMHKINYNTVLFPTYIDAVEFAKVYKCDPEELAYFKL